MSTEQPQVRKGELPENAYRPLRSGEKYIPVVNSNKVKEVTAYSVGWGILMAVIFSAATAYLGLKVGQVFEAAIPIAIIAAGITTATKRKNALLENVMIQSIGAASGVVVAGAIFTIPAIFILSDKYPGQMHVDFFQIFLSALLGGILGILMLVPFRRYFVKDMHGEFPFPEATATTQVLLSSEKGGAQAKPLLISGVIGGLYDFAVSTLGAWHEVFSSRILLYGAAFAEKTKLVFKLNTGAAVMGLGYIIGLKYAAIICAGSALVWWVIVPLMSAFWGGDIMAFGDPAITIPIGQMSAEEIFTNYGRNIGIGGIAMAGLISIWNSRKIITGAIKLAGTELKGKTDSVKSEDTPRTDRDISMKFIVWGVLLALVAIGLFFYIAVVHHNALWAIVGVILVAIIAFLFTTVAANAIAIVGSNPVSGMTLMTLILASVVLVAVGMNGPSGMVSALIIGVVVCTALSMAGGFITDLKIGYWLGSTPKAQQSWKFLGTLVAAATVCGVVIILEKAYGFTGEGSLSAPQANAMAALIEPLMMGGGGKWALYGIGALLALVLTLIKVPALPFALGMFIPLQLNLPLIVGGFISWYVGSRSKDAALNKARKDKGTLLASGFIAGGALMGVVSAILKLMGVDLISQVWLGNVWSHVVTVVMYIAIFYYLIRSSKKVEVE
ncbi:oligopeptide transporter, OPT family [Porphyromonadaceae bacterium W3.11]|nr:oligopeptide transporter, OPT family [Porphyromonadaceae bacterium W3.11]